MTTAGVNPFDDKHEKVNRVPQKCLAEFDWLMAQGGIEAIIEALKSNENRGEWSSSQT